MARALINVPAEERAFDGVIGSLINECFCALLHTDPDVLPTSVGAYDLGCCDKCYVEQWLCFPSLGFRVPIRNRRVITFDPTIPHCASSMHIVRKSDCTCSPKRFAVVPFSSAKYFGKCTLRNVVLPSSKVGMRVEHSNPNSERKTQRIRGQYKQ